jgi:hypothetical protein
MTDNAPGWQADPTGRHDHRYWDGSQWTDNVSDAGVASTDAYVDAAATADDAGAGGDATAVEEAAAEEAAAAPEGEPPGWADPTTAMPAASTDPTATWPTSPAPPAPPSYTPPPPGTGGPLGPDGSGGSKRGLLIGGGILAAVAVAVIAFLLLGGGDDDDADSVRTQMAAQFRANSELTGDQADCVADHVVDELGVDRLEGVDFTADEPPEEIADDLFAAAVDSLEPCDIDPGDFAESGDDEPSGDGTYGSDPELDALYDQCEDGDYQACDDLYSESPSGSEYEEFADTCGDRNEPGGYCVDIYEDGDGPGTGDLPADFEKQLSDIYENSLGLSAEQAECLAGKLAAAVSSGDLDESEAFSEVFEFLSECDIDPSDLNGG